MIGRNLIGLSSTLQYLSRAPTFLLRFDTSLRKSRRGLKIACDGIIFMSVIFSDRVRREGLLLVEFPLTMESCVVNAAHDVAYSTCFFVSVLEWLRG